jgi:hypothetical protein
MNGKEKDENDRKTFYFSNCKIPFGRSSRRTFDISACGDF